MKRMINELMDSSADYTVTLKKSNIFTASFMIGDEEVDFLAKLDKDPLLSDDFENTDVWLISFARDNEYKVTGHGEQYLIFGTVAKIFEEFIKEYKPDKFEFTAKEKSRQKLYRIFAEKISKEFNYYFGVTDPFDDGTEEFLFVRK